MAPWDVTFRTSFPNSYLWLGVIGLSASLSVGLALQTKGNKKSRKGLKQPWTPSPRKTLLPKLSEAEISALSYPPDVLPGAREVETPYGSINVYEWGPEEGEKVLLMHGISTPCLCQSDMAEELVAQGYRVMLFDYFGRGYSDAPTDVPFDTRLYTTQILLVLASSPLSWTGNDSFHLMGYSFGGAMAASFAGYFPHLVRSLTLIAGGGLIRTEHISWRSKLVYSEGIFPEWFVQSLVRARLTAPPTKGPSVASEIVNPNADALDAQKKQRKKQKHENSDVNGGEAFDNSVLSRHRPGITVGHVMEWQVRHHEGFVPAFISSIRHGPIYEQQEDWIRLGKVLEERRERALPGLKGGRILLVLGATDPIIVKEELVHDATVVLTEEGFEARMLNCGHQIAIAKGQEVAQIATEFWKSCAAGF